jgi:hypothetical protein
MNIATMNIANTHIELATFDAHHPRAQLGRPSEAHDDRGRRREGLGFEPEALAGDVQGVLELVRGSAVAVQCASEDEHESDRRFLIAHGPQISDRRPKSTNARAATQAFEPNLNPD